MTEAPPRPDDERATDRAPDVFVSYAREDTAFVQRLYASLTDAGRSVFVDFRGIPVWSPDWQGVLYEAIDGADAFLFVLTPDSLASPNVALELRHAVEQGKRLKPLQLADVSDAEIDPELRRPQWIDFRDPAAFDARVADLVAFLDTDVEWVRRHTRFGVLANEWTGRREDRSLLLGRSDLREAEEWLAGRDGKEPAPTALQLRFVEASRANARRRRRILVAAVALAVAVAAVLGTVALLQTRSASTSADAAESRRLAVSAVAALATDPAEGLRLAVQAAKVAPTQQAVLALRQALAQSHARAVLRAGGAVTNAAFSPDGELAAARTIDGDVAVWDAATAEKLATLTGPVPLDAFAFTPDGDRIVTVSGPLQVWDARTGELVTTLPGSVTERHVVEVSPDGRLAATSGFDGVVAVWSLATGERVTTLRGHRGGLRALVFSPDGDRVLTVGDDRTARIWNAATGAELARLATSDPGATAAWSPDSARVALANGAVRVFDARSGREVARLAGDTSRVSELAASPDGTLLASGDLDGEARIWDARTGELRDTLRGHGDGVARLAFSRDSRLLVTAGWDGTARVWDARSGAERAELRGHAGAVTAAGFSPDGSLVLTAGSDGTARIWAAGSGERVAVVEEAGGPAYVLALSPQGDLVASARNNELLLWRPETGELVHTARTRARWVDDVAFSPDGRYVLTAAAYGTDQLWDAESGEETASLGEHRSNLAVARFSPDGTFAVTASPGAETRVWRVPDGEEVVAIDDTSCRGDAAISPDGAEVATTCGELARVWPLDGGPAEATLRGHTGTVTRVAYSPDGERILTADSGGAGRLWDAGSGVEEAELRGHTKGITDAAFGPGGERVVTGSYDQTARIWSAATGEQVAVLTGHAGPVRSVAFSPDGDYVVTAGGDGTVRVWDAVTGDPVETFRDHTVNASRAAFGPDGTLVASVGADRTARTYRCRLCVSVDELVELAERELPPSG